MSFAQRDKNQFLNWSLKERLAYRRAPHRRGGFLSLSAQRHKQTADTLWRRGIDDASIGTGRRWRYRNRRINP